MGGVTATRFASWKIPLVLLVGVGGFWLWSRYEAHKQLQIQSVAMIGPTISLAKESSGSWSLTWPEWHERKWDAVLFGDGVPYLPAGETASYSLQVRVDPPDAVKIGLRNPKPVDGWFELGNRFDGDTVAVLDPAHHAKTIEYRVTRADMWSDRFVVLRVEGSNDPSLLEGALVGTLLADVICGLAAFPLLIWFGVASVQRWRARSAQAAPLPA